MSDLDDCQEAVKRLTRDREAVMREGQGGRTMSDIVRRLRSHDDCLLRPIRGDVAEAADEIERLLAEVERLREALQSIAGNTCCDSCQEAARVARKALENNRLAAHADTLAALDAAAAKTDKEGAR